MDYEQIQERRNRIIALLKKNTIMTVEDVCVRLGITDSTARRDIKWLEEHNMIHRFHGGISSTETRYDLFNIRNKKYKEVKERIAKIAAKFVCSHDIIFVGGGSTMFQFSKALVERDDINNVVVVTSTFNVAGIFAENKRFEIVFLGGTLKRTDEAIVSRMAIDTAGSLNYTKAFNGSLGITEPHGVTQPTVELAEMDRIVTDRSKKNYLLVDHEKFFNVGPYSAYGVDKIYKIITDNDKSIERLDISPEFRDKIVTVWQ